MTNDVLGAAAPTARFRNVIEGEWHFEPGVGRVLHVHSRGARRFSPFCCFVTAYGVNKSIESHYQESKIFEGGRRPRDWREAKSFGKRRPHGLGLRQTGWQIGPHLFDVTPNARGTSFTVDDAGVQFYIRLWHRHLTAHPELVEEARQYDGWLDPFEGDFPFGQAKVFELVARRGVAALEPLFAPLVARIEEIKARGK